MCKCNENLPENCPDACRGVSCPVAVRCNRACGGASSGSSHCGQSVEAALKLLDARGYVVAAWSPEELGTAKPRALEDALITFGNEYLRLWQ